MNGDVSGGSFPLTGDLTVIGAAIATLFAEAGAAVVVHGRGSGDADHQCAHAPAPRLSVPHATQQEPDAALPDGPAHGKVVPPAGQLCPLRGLAPHPRGGKWKLNLEPGRPERVRLAGRDVQARPDIVAGHYEVGRLLAIMTDANPRTARFIPIPRRGDDHFDRAALASAISHGFRIVRWHLDQSAVELAAHVPGRR